MADLHRVVRHQAVAPLDQLHGGLALTDAGLAHQEHAFAVHVHQHAMAGDPGGKAGLQPIGEVGDEEGGILLTAQDGPLMLHRHLHQLREGGQATGEDQSGDGEFEERIKTFLTLLWTLVVQVGPLHLADDLDPVGGKVVEKAENLQGRAVDVIGAHKAVVIILAGIEHFQLKPLDHFGQFDGRLICHGSSSSTVPGRGGRAGPLL